MNTVLCPQCGTRVQIPAEYQGRTLRCPECKDVFDYAASDHIVEGEPPAGPARSAGGDYSDDVDIRTVANVKPPRALATAVKALFILQMLAILAMLWNYYLSIDLADAIVENRDAPGALASSQTRQNIFAVVAGLLYLVSAIVFLTWFHRVYANTMAFNDTPTNYGAGWAVGCWFVPFLNLVRPVQIAQEIWRRSNPALPRDEYPDRGNSWIIGLWWFAWLVSNVVRAVSNSVGQDVHSAPTLKTAAKTGMVSCGLTLLAAMLALTVVSAISKRQQARIDALGKEQL